MSLEEHVVSLLNHHARGFTDPITLDTDFVASCDMDSLDQVETMMVIEEEFAQDLRTEDMLRMRTARDIVTYLQERGVK